MSKYPQKGLKKFLERKAMSEESCGDMMSKEVKELSKVIKSFTKGKSVEEILLLKLDDLSRHILSAGYKKEK